MNFVKWNVPFGRILLVLGIVFFVGQGYATDRRSFPIIRRPDRSQTKAINPTVQEIKDKMPKKLVNNSSCHKDADCSQPNCLDCGAICAQNRCVTVSCKDHGTYDWKDRKCVCNKGYTGQYCEKKIVKKRKK